MPTEKLQKDKASIQYMPIRITVEYITDLMDLKPSDMENLRNKLIPDTINWIQNRVQVNPVSGNLTFSPCVSAYTKGVNEGKCASVQLPYTCGPVDSNSNISESYLSETICNDAQREDSCLLYPNGPGLPNTDLLLYIFVMDSGWCLLYPLIH